MEEKDRIIFLIPSEGEKEEISLKAALRSGLIKSIIEINPDSTEIPLKLKSEILKKVKEYLEHYKDKEPLEIERPFPSNNFKECVDEWDYNFTDIGLDIIFELILASNYLDIKSLLELGSAKISSILKGKTTEELKNIFNITNDFTPEEEQQIIEENKWCMENL